MSREERSLCGYFLLLCCFVFTVYKSLKLDTVLFFSSKSSWNVAVFTKKNQKKGIIIMGQVSGGKQLPAMGPSLAWASFVSAKSQASWQHAEKKGNLGVCLHLLSLSSVLRGCRVLTGSPVIVLSVANVYSQF